MDWVEINKVIKYTLKNLKHLGAEDTYLIEQATSDCQLQLKQEDKDVS